MFRNLLLGGIGVLAVFVLSSTVVSSQTYMIKQTVSMQGQKMTNTTYVKGPRKRTASGGMMGMGADVATIEQCDLKQNVKVNDKKKLYTVEPFDTDNEAPSPRPAAGARPKPQPTKRGGTVTYVNNITDTGERKQMFGVTARHLKTSMSMEASPDACSKADMKMESDGWYIDLPEFSCPVNFRPQTMPNYQAPQGGCQDHIVSRSTGSGKLGFPLQETRTMSMGGDQSFSQTTETIEFSRAPLEQSLFDVPTGYAIASDSQQLYGQPDMAAMMRAAQAGNNDDDSTRSGSNPSFNISGNSGSMPASFTGTKIAVLMPTSKGEGVSTSSLQMFLIDKLSGGNVRAMAVNSEADARAAGAAYILTSDISKLKQSKAGGLFGAVTGINAAAKYDAQVDYKLVKLADGSTVLSSKSASKSETEANAAAQNILGMEAVAVLGAVR
jgi:hypothetical protein